MVQYFHKTYIHSSIYFKLSLVYLSYLTQYKCYVNSCQYAANSSFAFWNFLELFFKNVFDPWLIESMDANPVDTESQLYVFITVKIRSQKSTDFVWLCIHLDCRAIKQVSQVCSLQGADYEGWTGASVQCRPLADKWHSQALSSLDNRELGPGHSIPQGYMCSSVAILGISTEP